MFFTAVQNLEASNVFTALNAADIAINRGNPPQQNILPISTSNNLLGSFASDTFGLSEKGKVLSELDVEANAVAAGESPASVIASAPGSLASPKASSVSKAANALPAGTVNVAASNVVSPASFFSQNPGIVPPELSKLTPKAGQVACGDGPGSVCAESLKKYGAAALEDFDKYLEKIESPDSRLNQEAAGTQANGRPSLDKAFSEVGEPRQQNATSPSTTSLHASGSDAASKLETARGTKLSDLEIFKNAGGDQWRIIEAPNGVLIKVPKNLITWSDFGEKIDTDFDTKRLPFLVFEPKKSNHMNSTNEGTVKLVTGCLCAGLEEDRFIKDILESMRSPEYFRSVPLSNIQTAMSYQQLQMNALARDGQEWLKKQETVKLSKSKKWVPNQQGAILFKVANWVNSK